MQTVINEEYEENFRIYILPHYDNVLRYLKSIVQQKELAEDLAQNTFEKAWESMSTIRDLNKAKSWLFTVARNQFVSEIRKHHENTCFSESLNLDTLANFSTRKIIDISDELLKNEKYHTLLEAFYLLPDQMRQLISLKALTDLNMKQISIIMHLNYGTTRVYLHRARKMLISFYRELYRA